MRSGVFTRLRDLARPASARDRQPLRLRPALDFSFAGLLYCLLMLFMGLAALNSGANLLFGIFGLMIGILIISGVISRLVLRGLLVHRVLPLSGVVGVPSRIVYEFRNQKRYWPSLSISLAELDGVDAFAAQPECYMLHTAPAATTSVTVDVLPVRRGLYHLRRYQLATGFPFGFVKRAQIFSRRDKLLIYPAIGQLDPRFLLMSRSAQASGARVRPAAGGVDEFWGVKEFRDGENRRNIYWRRSARTGVLVAREMTRVSPPRLLLLLDTPLGPPAVSSALQTEQLIAMAATLASGALEQGLSVGLFAWQNGWISLPPDGGKQQRAEALSILAQLDPDGQPDLSILLEQCAPLIRSDITPVLFTPRNVQLGMLEESRSAMLIVTSASTSWTQYFRFPSNIDFARSAPLRADSNSTTA